MSQWRRVAKERLPEFGPLIDSDFVDNPISLWIELNMKFDDLCKEDVPNMDLIRRVWAFCLWCLKHRSRDVGTAAALGFCEHLIDNNARASILPSIMSRKDFEALRDLLVYHNSEKEYQDCLERLWPKRP